MSKLYNTLEQIRRQETYQVAASNNTADGKGKTCRRRGRILGLFVVAAGAAILLYLGLPLLGGHLPAITGPASKWKTMFGIGQPGEKNPAAVLPSTAPVPGTATDIRTAAGSAVQPAGTGSEQGETPEQKFTSLNNRGVDCLRKFDYWKGLYWLDQARKLQPRRVEPLINTAVGLAELGFNELAVNYLKQAAELEPGHPMLQANLDVLKLNIEE